MRIHSRRWRPLRNFGTFLTSLDQSSSRVYLCRTLQDMRNSARRRCRHGERFTVGFGKNDAAMTPLRPILSYQAFSDLINNPTEEITPCSNGMDLHRMGQLTIYNFKV